MSHVYSPFSHGMRVKLIIEKRDSESRDYLSVIVNTILSLNCDFCCPTCEF